MLLPEIDRLRLTSVVDNFVDNLLKDQGPARRRPRGDKSWERCMCAEHGLAEVVESMQGGKVFPLLFDFGATPLVYLHNLDLLLDDWRIDLKTIETLVLSHGHWDHYGGLTAFLDRKRDELPAAARLYAGDDAFLHRTRKAPQGGKVVDMGQLDEAYIAGKRVEIVKVKTPEVLGGQALISGEIARRTAYETGSPVWRVEREGADAVDNLDGEQALVYHLKGKGLVVLTACGHAGIVNTVLHAREVTGVEKIHAIVGGFHLSAAPTERIAQTVDGLAAFDPELIVPMHCTGIDTIQALERRLPGRIVYNSAGTQYELVA